MSSTDDRPARLAELQRLAYGAGGTDEERAAAAAELHALRGDSADARGEQDASARRATGTIGMVADPPDASTETSPVEAPSTGSGGTAAAERRVHRRLVAVGVITGVAGLLLGGLGGWQLAERAAAEAADAAPRPGTVAASAEEERAAALEGNRVVQTGAFRTLQLDDPGAELPAVWAADRMLDAESTHLLRSAGGGIEVYGVMTRDHADVCLILMVGGGGGMTCTEGGVFPGLGLTIATGAPSASSSALPTLEARWWPDGTLQLMTEVAEVK